MEPATLIGLGGIAADVLGGLLGDRGQRDANRKNLQIAREQMAFQERMSNTAYQRAAKDLEAAGLNRILALGSGASTPTGARAQMANPAANRAEAARRAVHSAMTLKQQQEQIHLMASQAANLDAGAANQSAQAAESYRRREVLDDTQREIQARIGEITQRTRTHSAQADIQGAYADFYNQIPSMLIALEKIPVIGYAAAQLGRTMLQRRRKPSTSTTQTSRYDRQGVYGGGSVTTRSRDR